MAGSVLGGIRLRAEIMVLMQEWAIIQEWATTWEPEEHRLEALTQWGYTTEVKVRCRLGHLAVSAHYLLPEAMGGFPQVTPVTSSLVYPTLTPTLGLWRS